MKVDMEIQKKKLEYRKVETAMMEMEFRILERMEDIERLKSNIENQKQRMEVLQQEIKDMEV